MVICDLHDLQLPEPDEREPPPPYDDDDDYEYDEYEFWYSSSPPIFAPIQPATPLPPQAATSQPNARRVVANPRGPPIFSPRLSHYIPTNERYHAPGSFLSPQIPSRNHLEERNDHALDDLTSPPSFTRCSGAALGDLGRLASPPRLPAYFPPENAIIEDEPTRVLDRQGYSSFFQSGLITESPQVATKVNTLWHKIQHALESLKLKWLKGAV